MVAKEFRVLVTGGAGFIGSHTVVELANAGYEIVILDNLSNSSEESVNRVRRITEHPESITFVKAELTDVDDVLAKHGPFGSVIHFAALKAVGESVSKPIEYYENNISTLLVLLRALVKHDVPRIVFSSSATVYGSAKSPCLETTQTGVGIMNPYGQTKFMAEQILRDFVKAHPKFTVALLRYFNPVGAHSSGLIGEDPQGIPNNLVPYIQRVAAGRLPHLNVFGTDYPTADGSARRDYIHVVDLAIGHLHALKWLQTAPDGLAEAFNLGSGTPMSVFEVVAAFEKASGKKIPVVNGPRRDGDAVEVWANAEKARDVLKWATKRGIDEMCRDSWNWVAKNPFGYKASETA